MDIEKIRKDTPGTAHVAHFNSAGASLMSNGVLSAQISYLRTEANQGGYETAALYREQLEDFYPQAARLISSDPNEIAFTESATVAWQRAFFSIPFKKGDNIITAKSEYASNYISFLHLKQQKGIEIKIAPSNAFGEIDVEELEKLIDKRTKLIAITHMPTNSGLVNPAEEVGKVAQNHGVLYLLDACQSVGQYPINVEKIGCHFLSATGRKFLRGPRGTGFLYANRKIVNDLTPTNLDLHSAEWESCDSYKMVKNARKFETWESNLAAKAGLTVAIKEANEHGMIKIWDRVINLSAYLRTELEQISGVTVRDIGNVKSGIVTFTTDKPVDEIKEKLGQKGFNTTIAIKSGTLLDMSDRNLEEVIRSSVHYFNTTEEIDRLIIAINDLLN